MRPDKSRNKLTALYVDYKALPNGLIGRLGRETHQRPALKSREQERPARQPAVEWLLARGFQS